MAQTAGASRILTESVQYPGDGIPVPGFLARQASQPEFGAPAILLLHEWWGLNEQIKGLARRFAEAGFAALAPDLYSRQGRKVTADPQEASALMSALSSQWMLRDLNQVTRHLRSQAFIDPARVGVVGFSMGGLLALDLAGHHSDLKAVSAFYAKVPPVESVSYQLAPVQIHHAGKDAWVTRKEVDAFRLGLEQNGKSGEIFIYPEADHGFFNETRPEVYRAQDAALAWSRTVQFLQTHLQ